MFKAIMLVGIGGFVGSVARYVVKIITDKYLPATFPYGTLAVNMLGCFFIGLLFGMLERNHISNSTWLIWATGFCGGFTTFSTFALESNIFIVDKLPLGAIGYAVISVVVGILLCRWGINIAR